MKSIRKAIILGALSLAAVTRLPAQVAPLASSIEGTISAIELVNSEVFMTVMGIRIRVVRNLETAELITSPTRNLTLEQLGSTVVLPGRTATGFRQGTAIVEGTWNAAANRMEATSVFVEPAENVLLGQVTAAAGGGTVGSINGAPIFMLPVADNTPNTITAGHLLPRVGTTSLRHEVGIPLASIAVGALAAAEGYFDGTSFRAFVVDASDGVPLSTAVQVVINRAETRERTPNTTRGDEYDARGGSYSPAGTAQRVALYRVDVINNIKTYTLLGNPVATVPDVNPRFQTWRVNGVTPVLRNTSPAVLGTAPSRLVAAIIPAGVTAPVSATDGTAAFTSLVRSAEFEPTLIP